MRNLDDVRFSKNNTILSMLICTVLWSSSGLFIKLLPWNPLVITCLRSAIAAITLFLYVKIIGEKVSFNKKILAVTLVLSARSIAFITATKLTASANAIALQNAGPIYIMLISFFFFKEIPRRKDVFTILVAMGGIVLFFIGDFDRGVMFGNILALLSGMLSGIFYTMVGKFKSYSESICTIMFGHAMTALCTLPFVFIFKPEITVSSVIFILVLGFLQQGLGYVLYSFAIRSANPLFCSVVTLIEPILNPMWVFLFVKEMPSKFAILGAIIVLGAVTFWSVSNILSSRKRSQELEEAPSENAVSE